MPGWGQRVKGKGNAVKRQRRLRRRTARKNLQKQRNEKLKNYENRREWKIAIDWEYYLDAEGDELQDAYDLAVEEAEEMLGWDEEWDND